MRQLSAWLWRLPVYGRRSLLFVTTVGVVAVIGLKLSGGLFLGPADGLTAALWPRNFLSVISAGIRS